MNQLDLEEAKEWLKKRAKMNESQREKDPDFPEKMIVVNRVWDQWQTDFANCKGNLDHPFLKNLVVKKKLEKYDEETWESIRERLGLRRVHGKV